MEATFTQGTIIKGIGGFYYVKCQDEIFETRACGRFRKEHIVPICGDNVILSENNDSVVEILPRKNEFIRPPVANIDAMLIVVAAKSPEPDYRMVDSLLVNVENRGIDAVICINKTDLISDEKVKEMAEIYKKAGYKTILTSTVKEEGREELLSVLEGKITALSGNSGVGKSSILNFILGDETMETGDVSRKLERGRHTTRHVELFPIGNSGFILDTPGFGKMDLPKMTSDMLADFFKEFEEFNEGCRFGGCKHLSEPDCAVKSAVEQNLIAKERYESYKYFYDQLKNIKEWTLK